MDKRYQVFISSTFLDLREERQAVSQALLRSDCFPAQMENWPAMDAEQMEAIKQIIDESDYFVVISAGKYGSVNPEMGLSYTEMEYDYAVEIGKSIIRLLHRDPFGALTGKQIESKAGIRKKLEAFHAKLKAGSVCSFWENADRLEKETVFALVDIKKRKPAIGWARADRVSSSASQLKISELQEQNRMLTNAFENTKLNNFAPILSGLEGEVSLNRYEVTQKSIFDDSALFDIGDPVELTRARKRIRMDGISVRLPSAVVLKRIAIGLLFASDFDTAVALGLSTSDRVGLLEKHVFLPSDENELVKSFMSLEVAGLFSSGDVYDGSRSLVPSDDNMYLRRTNWRLSDDFRNWLLDKSVTPFAPKTPPQSAP